MPELYCHLHSPSRVARSVSVEATRTAQGRLSLHYALHGDVARMNIAPPAPPRIGWKLWRRTCCEVFVRAAGEDGYHEFNFSPSGEWGAFAFTGYREGTSLVDEALNPRSRWSRATGDSIFTRWSIYRDFHRPTRAAACASAHRDHRGG